MYVEAWETVLAKRKHRLLANELLWHKVYEEYINSLTDAEPRATKAELIESHLHILGPIAGQIAWKRCPKSFGIWAKECQPSLSHIGLVHELAAFGVLGLIVAADRYKPRSGNAFITYANFWVKKFISLYLEEIIGNVPRTGHMGIKEQGINSEGEPWVVYKPRRSVMDIVEAALDGHRLYRGKAAGGMAFFDSGFSIPGPNSGDKEIEVVGSDGLTDPNRLDYLQRRVTKKDYPWIDMGAYQLNGALWPISELVEPARRKQIELLRKEFGIVRPMNGDRLALPGHTGGKADDGPPRDFSYTPDEIDDIEIPDEAVPRKRVRLWEGGKLLRMYGPSIRQREVPAEICYLPKSYFTNRQQGTPSHESEILRRADAVQVTPGASRRRGRRITQAHDVPVSILPASSAREVGA